ncbi:lipopolysaccharide transport periplasmic protein LptA [Trichloromonas sp.]|uniref:lipopolysaccharide transport periplasmic protein LptA n=1 Tax=Trichloromonas sp. TaxID=3069249 RepID=UPI002A48313F|nr:lipopolysaccharide transport periplasmic protein LptA [Trichloromonas sp.]
MKAFIPLRSLLLCLFLLAVGAVAGAAEKTSALGAFDNSQPIEITSDRLEGDDPAGFAKFSGSVVAKQGDATIYADEVTIHYSPGKTRDIDQVVAVGNVRIVQGERTATGNKAVFYNRESKVVLTGSPKVHQGKDSVEGDEITVFLNEERSVVTGKEGGRVNAVFHPQGGGK